MKCKSHKCRSIQIAFVIVLYFIPVHKFLFNFFITFSRDFEHRFLKDSVLILFLPACFYTLMHLTHLEYFIKILQILSQFLMFDMVRWLPNQNKSSNYILKKNLLITCNIEASESGTACNITPIPVPFVYYFLRFPFFILKIDQNL